MIRLTLDGEPLTLPAGTSVAAALAASGDDHARRDLAGRPRAPLCGMGICQECRVSIDGRRRLACLTMIREGMRVERLG